MPGCSVPHRIGHDPDQRGWLDEVPVVRVGEFGRAPRITRANAGRAAIRPCWPGAGCVGIVHGASDRWAACPTRDPVCPDDLGATTLHTLEIDPATEFHDPTGRPMRINSGRPLAPLFS